MWSSRVIANMPLIVCLSFLLFFFFFFDFYFSCSFLCFFCFSFFVGFCFLMYSFPLLTLTVGVTVWHPKWRQSGWKKSNGGKVENQDLIESIINLLESKRHKVEFVCLPLPLSLPLPVCFLYIYCSKLYVYLLDFLLFFS